MCPLLVLLNNQTKEDIKQFLPSVARFLLLEDNTAEEMVLHFLK